MQSFPSLSVWSRVLTSAEASLKTLKTFEMQIFVKILKISLIDQTLDTLKDILSKKLNLEIYLNKVIYVYNAPREENILAFYLF